MQKKYLLYLVVGIGIHYGANCQKPRVLFSETYSFKCSNGYSKKRLQDTIKSFRRVDSAYNFIKGLFNEKTDYFALVCPSCSIEEIPLFAKFPLTKMTPGNPAGKILQSTQSKTIPINRLVPEDYIVAERFKERESREKAERERESRMMGMKAVEREKLVGGLGAANMSLPLEEIKRRSKNSDEILSIDTILTYPIFWEQYDYGYFDSYSNLQQLINNRHLDVSYYGIIPEANNKMIKLAKDSVGNVLISKALFGGNKLRPDSNAPYKLVIVGFNPRINFSTSFFLSVIYLSDKEKSEYKELIDNNKDEDKSSQLLFEEYLKLRYNVRSVFGL